MGIFTISYHHRHHNHHSHHHHHHCDHHPCDFIAFIILSCKAITQDHVKSFTRACNEVMRCLTTMFTETERKHAQQCLDTLLALYNAEQTRRKALTDESKITSVRHMFNGEINTCLGKHRKQISACKFAGAECEDMKKKIMESLQFIGPELGSMSEKLASNHVQLLYMADERVKNLLGTTANEANAARDVFAKAEKLEVKTKDQQNKYIKEVNELKVQEVGSQLEKAWMKASAALALLSPEPTAIVTSWNQDNQSLVNEGRSIVCQMILVAVLNNKVLQTGNAQKKKELKQQLQQTLDVITSEKLTCDEELRVKALTVSAS